MERPFYIRRQEALNIKESHPDKVPIVVKTLKNKFLVSKDVSFGQFVFVIRKYISMKPEEAIFLFIKNKLVPSTMLMRDIYNEYKSPDGFVYVTYSKENTFG